MCVYKNVIFTKELILRLRFTVRMIQLQPQCKVDLISLWLIACFTSLTLLNPYPFARDFLCMHVL